MVSVKNEKQLKMMVDAGKIAAHALKVGGDNCKAGITTKELDRIIKKDILQNGATPSFLGYGGFPGSACISINDEVIHGIPSQRKIAEGDVVSIDVGAYYNGFHGDNAATFPVGKISDDAKKLLDATCESLYRAIDKARSGARIGDVSEAVSSYVEELGYSVVKDFVGHGIGEKLHEPPSVPNFGEKGRGIRLVPGMTIAIEPMINLIGAGIFVLDDKWTVKTSSGSISAHFEHTIAITEAEPIILTKI